MESHDEEELEEFQLIEKLQQLGINQGESAAPPRCFGFQELQQMLASQDLHMSSKHVVFHAGDIKKAKEAGYHTCESLLMNTRKVGHLYGRSHSQGVIPRHLNIHLIPRHHDGHYCCRSCPTSRACRRQRLKSCWMPPASYAPITAGAAPRGLNSR